MATRATSDEHHVIDLCDEILRKKGLRQHRFDWLLGDRSTKTGRHLALPVDAYWPDWKVVVEFAERQHDEPVAFFDKPDGITVSGISRGQQRALYDRRRAEQIPARGILLVTIPSSAFGLRRHRIQRDRDRDRDVVRSHLVAAGVPGISS